MNKEDKKLIKKTYNAFFELFWDMVKPYIYYKKHNEYSFNKLRSNWVSKELLKIDLFESPYTFKLIPHFSNDNHDLQTKKLHYRIVIKELDVKNLNIILGKMIEVIEFRNQLNTKNISTEAYSLYAQFKEKKELFELIKELTIKENENN